MNDLQLAEILLARKPRESETGLRMAKYRYIFGELGMTDTQDN
jgi:hypothetical protein